MITITHRPRANIFRCGDAGLGIQCDRSRETMGKWTWQGLLLGMVADGKEDRGRFGQMPTSGT